MLDTKLFFLDTNVFGTQHFLGPYICLGTFSKPKIFSDFFFLPKKTFEPSFLDLLSAQFDLPVWHFQAKLFHGILSYDGFYVFSRKF